ncbi:MAG: DUF4357 domain-containing protein [Lachnospiraceae bacterium]|nr:DUF4357 domain-containing protein [Lachnospiraceae bacterium]
MEASPMSLFEKFIKEAYGSQYVIPVYQRNYTWRKNKQVKQLLADIERILKGETKKHFIGTVVYNIVKTDFMVREREVVDGQQRLITMFLIAYALRNLAKAQGENDIASAITSSYLENNSSDIKYKYRLQPSVSDDDAYSYIAKDIIGDYEGTSLVMENYNYLYSSLEILSKEYPLMKVINAIREIYIVRIELDSDDDAQQIFESINSTGEKLTAADLIRNYVMMRRTNDEQETIYENYWLKLERIFPESKKLAEFIRFYLASKTYTLTTEKDLYPVFKDYWKAHDGENKYLDILEEVLHYAQHFERLYLSEKKDPLGEQLNDFRKLQSFMPAPFSIRMLEHLRLNEITQEQAKRTLKALNTYLIRRYINGQDTSAISRFFPGYLKNVEAQIEINDNFDKYVDICIYYLVNENKANSKFMPDDTQLRSYLETANAYTLSNIRWVLDKIESHNNPAPVDLSALNIEHIMPQTQNEYWADISGLDEDEYTKVVNRLGNLTLAASSDNSKMGNKDFSSKKKILETTKHLNLNAPILSKDSWTVADIEARCKTLVNKIIEIFPYEKSSYEVVGKDSKRYITLEAKGIVAMGYLNEDESLTVYADSQVFYDTAPSAESLKEMRDDFLEQEIIIQKDGGYVFAQSHTFGSPSTAADFIIGGSNNGWNYWKDSAGVVINDSLRKKS